MAHITGGGLTENVPRVLSRGLNAEIDTASWRWPGVFSWLADQGQVATAEMYRTFNCGVGMVVVVSSDQVEPAIAALEAAGEKAWLMGRVTASQAGAAPEVVFR
jgi:phosphoribosylformylglycinamidine cyclo-ligase